MLSYTLSVGSVFGACTILVMMVIRSQYLPTLARYAILAAASGLLMSSQYAEADHSTYADVFIMGNIVLMIVVALRHFRAFPRIR